MLALERLHTGVGPHVNLQVGVLRETLPALVALVLDDLVVHLVLVSVEGILGGEDLFTQSTVKLCRFLVNGIHVSLQGLAVTVILSKAM